MDGLEHGRADFGLRDGGISANLRRRRRDRLSAKHLPPPGTHKFYFAFGTATLDASYEPFQQRMDAVLRAAGYTGGRDWFTRKFPGAEHSEKSWRVRG